MCSASLCVIATAAVLSMPTPPFCRLLRAAAGPASCGGRGRGCAPPLRRLHLATTSSSSPSFLLLSASSRSSSLTSSRLSWSPSSSTPLLSSFVFVSCRSYTTRKKNKNMPPKKAPVQEKVMLGRPGNNLKSGIVCELCPHRLVFPFFFLKHPPTSLFIFFFLPFFFLPL